MRPDGCVLAPGQPQLHCPWGRSREDSTAAARFGARAGPGQPSLLLVLLPQDAALRAYSEVQWAPPPQNRTIFTIQLLPSAPSSHHLSPELVSLLLPRPPTVWSTQQPERTSPKSHHAPRRIHPTAPHFHFLPLPFTPLRPHGPLAAPQPPRASPRPTSQPGSALHLGQSWDRLPGPGELCSLSDHEPWPQCHPLFRPPPGQPRPALGHSPLPSICCL